MEQKTNYVISAWSGPRRNQKQWNFLEHHLHQLKALTHDLTQVTIVIPEHQEHLCFTEVVNKTNAVVLRRENKGLSYGSYSYAYDVFGNNFDYYIFIEDDHIFLKDHFDSILLELIEKDKIDYLASLVWGPPERNVPRHAACEAGMIRSTALAKVKQKYGHLPYSHKCNNSYFEEGGQVNFSRAFEEVGCKLDDFSHIYRVPFWDEDGFHLYGNSKGNDLIVPFEWCEKHKICQSFHRINK